MNNNPIKIFLFVFVLTLTSLQSRAGTDLEGVEAAKSAKFFAAPDSPDYRKYAPDRDVQMIHLSLDVTPDFKKRTVAGTATLRFKAAAKPVPEVKLNAVDLNVHSVTSTEKILGYQVTDEFIIVTFAEPLAPSKEATLTIQYDAEPTEGMYFRTPEMGYKDGDTHFFSQGEEIEARHWYPCMDSPNQKFTSEITCHLPEGMTSISNGKLVSNEKDLATGMVAWHWSQEKPHANYLISLCAGYFKKLEDKYKDLPIAFYTPPSEIDAAASSFKDTRDMLSFFEQEIGIPYPWAKYDQVCVNDFVAGGMENTSCTTLTDSTLFTDEFENTRSSEGLVAHEMAHQWFGDYVTCKDWSHIWLNEGFATYYETLYAEHKHGRDALLYELYERTKQITGNANNLDSIVRRTYNTPADMFNYLAYPKGGWVLHMLRSQLGDDMYRRCIKTYVERHALGNVVSDDLRAVIEELSGKSFDQFFDQWLYHGGFPELEISYSWDERTKLARVSVRQVQKLSESVLLYNFPLPIRFKGSCGTADRTMQVKQKDEDFSFSLDCAPTSVRIDPDYSLLAKISFKTPNAMLNAQLEEKTDVIGRLLAVEQLGARGDKGAIAKLKQTLNKDDFYGVRVEAARALRASHEDEALDALLASTKQSDARVRREVVGAIAGYYRDTAYKSALDTLGDEKNPDVLATAIRSVSGYSKPEVHEKLLQFLNKPSFRNELGSTAVDGFRNQDDPTYIPALTENLSKNASAYTSREFGQGLETLAYLARNEEQKKAVREILESHLDDRRRRVQIGAINGLGTLGDTGAIAVLEKFASGRKESQERAAAERAITALRAGRKPADDFKNLRQEVLDLEKANRDLKRDFDALKKKVDAGTAQPPAKPKKSSSLPPPKSK